MLCMNKSCEFKVHFFSANPKYYMCEYVLLVYVKLFQNVGGDTIWDHLRGGHSCPIPLPKGGCYCPWPVHNLWYDWQWQIIIIHFGGCKWEFYHSQFRTDELRKILVILSWVSERSPSRVLGEDPWWPEKTLRPKKMEKFSSKFFNGHFSRLCAKRFWFFCNILVVWSSLHPWIIFLGV